MKYTINGFQQEKLMELGLNSTDTVILRFFQDILTSTSPRLRFEVINGNKHILLTVPYILKEIPIVGARRTLINRIDKLEEVGALVTFTEKKKGNYKYYGLGSNFHYLLDYEKKDPYAKVAQGLCKNDTSPYAKVAQQISYTQYPLHNNPNIYSQVTSNEEPDTTSLTSKNDNLDTLGSEKTIQLTQKQLSELIQQQVSKEMTKQQEEKVKQEVDDIEKDRNKEIREKVVEYFNRKCDTKYKNNSKQIKELVNGRITEGYTLEDFLQVIDNKCNEWKDTKMQQYLRPSTLFRKGKFEEYLNSVQGKMEVKNPYMKHYEINQQESDALDEIYGAW